MMDTDRLRVAVEALLVADPECLDGGELTALVAAASAVRGWLDAFEVRCTRRSRELAAAGTAPPPESLLGTAGRRSGKDAATVTERDRVCEATQSFEDALANGAVSAGHLDALANATRRLDDELRAEFFSHEDLLLDAATTLSVDSFERQCRDLSRHLVAARPGSDVDELERQRARSCVKRWIDKTTGMHHTHLELDPVRDATLHAARRRADPPATSTGRQRPHPVGTTARRRRDRRDLRPGQVRSGYRRSVCSPTTTPWCRVGTPTASAKPTTASR